MNDVDPFGWPVVPLSRGSLAQRAKRLVPGVVDAPFALRMKSEHGLVTHPAKRVWDHMLDRCFSEREQVRFPHYLGCTVSDEWLSFMAFYRWMAGQPWQGAHLDKDIILPGNKVYAPEFCAFVPPSLNIAIKGTGGSSKGLPPGVAREHKTGKFTARLTLGDGRLYLGFFETAMEAGEAYRVARRAKLHALADQQSDPRVARGLRLHAEAA
jgi:hypothetical protein